jgi:uncharacterized protein
MEEDSGAEFETKDEDYLVTRIDNVSVSNLGFIVFLKALRDKRVLPIFIGANEAQSIAIAYNNQAAPRPLTHDLLKNMLGMLDCEITKIQVTALTDNTFYGRIHFRKEGFQEMDIDARPSDAIALAIRYKAPIFVHKDVYESAAITVKEGNEEGEPVENTEEAPAGFEPAPINPIEKLKGDLARALATEQYEEAARLRDELKRLESGN